MSWRSIPRSTRFGSGTPRCASIRPQGRNRRPQCEPRSNSYGANYPHYNFVARRAARVAGGAAAQRRLSGATAQSLLLGGIALGLALIPANWQIWLAGGEAGDRVLTFARELGLMGLFFLAGTRFDLKEVWQMRRVSLFVGVTGLLLFSLTAVALLLLGQDGSAAITAAAAIVGTSVWLPSQLSLSPEKGATAAAPLKCAGVAMTLLSLASLHFYAVFHALSGRAMTRSAWAIVAVYEVVKLAVFFSFAYFVASRFLTRTEGRVSPTRTLIGYVLIAVLILVLAQSFVGQLGALAWAFAAGALLGRSEMWRRASNSGQPIAVTALLSFAFLPLLLQSHGRRLTDTGLGHFRRHRRADIQIRGGLGGHPCFRRIERRRRTNRRHNSGIRRTGRSGSRLQRHEVGGWWTTLLRHSGLRLCLFTVQPRALAALRLVREPVG
ncbi:MAG: cation:proton antiporter [Acidobacteria bacterium]|nr:cation:proton antiporter [Acidobacteriota bacterium]